MNNEQWISYIPQRNNLEDRSSVTPVAYGLSDSQTSSLALSYLTTVDPFTLKAQYDIFEGISIINIWVFFFLYINVEKCVSFKNFV